MFGTCPRERPLFDWIERLVPADTDTCSVADIGCGNGELLRYLRQKRPRDRFVGIDIAHLDPGEDIEFVRGDFLTTSFDEQFDVVTSLAVIEHVLDLDAFTSRLTDLCRPGGIVIITTVDARGLLYSWARWSRRLGIKLPTDRLYSTHHVHHFTVRSLRTMLERSGLAIADEYRHNAPLKAIALPATNPIGRPALLFGVWMSFALGKPLRRTFLQTLACTKTA